jgi:hypothetical protein
MMKKKDPNFDRIMEACEFHGLTHIMQFKYNCDNEIISQFYPTLYFDKQARIFKWMTKGRRFVVKLSHFAEILGMTAHMDNPKKLHNSQAMTNREMKSRYVEGSDLNLPCTDGILPHVAILHRMVRKTLAPRIGDANVVPVYEPFDASEYIVAEI